MFTAHDILFYIFAITAVLSGLAVIFVSNPIFSALFLALTMSILGAFFFMLEAYFVSVAQITVYAGAVMVLFVMVLMLFDLRHEREEVLKISPLSMVKLLSGALLCGFFIGTGWLAVSAVSANPGTTVSPQVHVQELEKSALQKENQTPSERRKIMEEMGQAETQTTQAAQTAQEGDQKAAHEQAQVHPEDEDLTNAEADSLVEKTSDKVPAPVEEFGSTASLSRILFSNYVFAFEAVSLLLLVAIVGSVALARSKGGTHHVGK